METMRVFLIPVCLIAAACSSASRNACPSSLLVEVDTMYQRGVWDTTASIQLKSVAGDCLPVHHPKTKFEDSSTSYRIPVTATLLGTFASQYDAYRYANEHLMGSLRIEAISAHGVALRSDTIPYRFIP